MFKVVTYRDWMNEYHNNLLCMYDIYGKYKKEDLISFDNFSILIFKSDFNIS